MIRRIWLAVDRSRNCYRQGDVVGLSDDFRLTGNLCLRTARRPIFDNNKHEDTRFDFLRRF